MILIIGGMHLLAIVLLGILLIPALNDTPLPPRRSSDDGDEGWGNGPPRPPARPEGPGGGIPLPDAVPAAARLRGPGRLADQRSRRERRPAREPDRRPVRERL